MSTKGKTDLQRDILLTWHRYPDATNSEIANMCDCSASYVSQIKNRFDSYDQMDAMIDRQDRELERMFGDDFFASSRSSSPALQQGGGVNVAEAWEELPDNPAGHLIRAMILLILLYVLYEVSTVLFL